MADVVISNTIGAAREGAAHDALVWASPSVGYIFYVNGTTTLVYRKTTDGGASWGANVTVASGTAINKFSVWYDRWTSGDDGTLIHIAFVRNSGDGTFYRNLNTFNDTFGGLATVAAYVNGSVVVAYTNTCCAITKARGGNLYIAYNVDAAPEEGFFRSIDAGASWVSRALVTEGVLTDKYLLLPGNESDNQDVWCIYWDDTADELSIKTYDNSGNSWSEQSISGGISLGFSAGLQMSGSTRHSDDHAIVCCMTDWNLNAATLKVWDINGAASIVALTDVYTAELNHITCALTVNQINDDLYVSFDGDPGDAYPNGLRLRYKVSTDGGTTWSAATVYDEDGAQGIRENWTDRSISVAGRWLIAWFDDVAAPDEIKTNFNNSIALLPTPATPTPPPEIHSPGGSFNRVLSGGAPGFITYLSPDGREYPLHTPHQIGRWVVSFSGLGTPPIDYITQRGPFQHGVTVKDFFLRPRAIQLLIRQAFCDRTAWWAGRAALLNEIRPNRQATATASVPGTLRIVQTDGTLRDLSVFIQEGPRFEPRVSGEWDEWAFQEVLRFIAHDPVAFDPSQVTATFTIALDANLVFPITFPITFGSGVVDGTLAITYPGTWLTFPVITIVGPIQTPRIDNNTTGEKIQFSIDVAPGRTLTIDLTEGNKTVVDDLGTNLIGGVTSDSDLATFHIAADPEAAGGLNTLRLRGTHPTGATSVSLAYFDRYFGF